MAVLLIGLAIMSIMLSVAMPVWHQTARREKEEELIFRGTQYARAVGLYQRKFAGGYPPSVDFLVQQKFLRKKYKDPMVPGGEFQVIPAGAAGMAGRTGQQSAQGNRQGGANVSFSVGGTLSSLSSGLSLSTSSSEQVVGPVAGVVSKSTEESIRLYNGRNHYNEWLFLYSSGQGRAGQGRGMFMQQGGRGGGRGSGGGRGGGMGRGRGTGSDQQGQGRGRGGRGGRGPGF
jgi:type II secretory pathway pseudopilin PulG